MGIWRGSARRRGTCWARVRARRKEESQAKEECIGEELQEKEVKAERVATVKVEEDPKAKGRDTKASVSTVASRGTREANLGAGWRRAHSPWT